MLRNDGGHFIGQFVKFIGCGTTAEIVHQRCGAVQETATMVKGDDGIVKSGGLGILTDLVHFLLLAFDALKNGFTDVCHFDFREWKCGMGSMEELE